MPPGLGGGVVVTDKGCRVITLFPGPRNCPSVRNIDGHMVRTHEGDVLGAAFREGRQQLCRTQIPRPGGPSCAACDLRPQNLRVAHWGGLISHPRRCSAPYVGGAGHAARLSKRGTSYRHRHATTGGLTEDVAKAAKVHVSTASARTECRYPASHHARCGQACPWCSPPIELSGERLSLRGLRTRRSRPSACSFLISSIRRSRPWSPGIQEIMVAKVRDHESPATARSQRHAAVIESMLSRQVDGLILGTAMRRTRRSTL